MKKVRKLLAILLVLTMALSLAACGGNNANETSEPAAPSEPEAAESAEPSAAGELPKVAFICKGYTDTFSLLVCDTFKEKAEAYKDEFTVEYFDGELNDNRITELIETCTASGFAAIVVFLQDPEAPVAAIKAAMEKGVHVICTAGAASDGGLSNYIDADPVQQATLLVEYLEGTGDLKEGTKVAILEGPAGMYHSVYRTQGFKDGIERIGCELVADEIANWKTSEAQTIVDGWLLAHPDLEVILSCNDDMALGAIESCKLAGREDVIAVGIDANEQGCIAVKQGKMPATVQQDSDSYAGVAAEMCSKLIKGEEVENLITDSFLITADEVDGVLTKTFKYTQEDIDALVK